MVLEAVSGAGGNGGSALVSDVYISSGSGVRVVAAAEYSGSVS